MKFHFNKVDKSFEKIRHSLEFGRWNLPRDTNKTKKNAARFVLLMCKSTAHQNNGRIYMNLYFFRCIIWYVSVHSFKNLLKRRRNTDECHHVTATCVSYLVFFFIRLHSLTLHKTHFIKILSTHGLRSDNGFGARACVFVW